MKRCGKVLFALLWCCVIMTVLSVSALAAEVVDSGTCGDNLTWTLDSDGVLTISGTGDMKNYSYASPWSSYNSTINSVVIGNGVTTIGDAAFRNCSSLDTVTIPESVTRIGAGAFRDCVNLDNVTIGDGVTSIEDSAFSGCSNLSSIIIPNSVITIGHWAFQNCHNLASVTIPSSVTTIEYQTFAHCSSLDNIIIPSSVTAIESWAFADCRSLTHISIPGSVVTIGGFAFEDCISLANVTIGDGVTSIGSGTFSGCTSLTSITIPNSVTSIGEFAFSDCSSLTSVTIGSGVASIEAYVFHACPSLANIAVNADNLSYTSTDGVLFDKIHNVLIAYPAGKDMTSYAIPNGVTTIGEYAFSACHNLTEITIPNSVTKIEEYAFYACLNLTEITIPNNVTKIEDYAFSTCHNLVSISIPDGIASIGYALFSYCTSLTSITIPESVTSIEDHAFAYCERLADVYYGGSKIEWRKISIGSNNTVLANAAIHYNGGSEPVIMASGTCGDALTWTLDSDGVLTISGTGDMKNYSGSSLAPWYSYKNSIISAVIAGNVTSIGHGAFFRCDSLMSVVIPDSVTTIGYNVFTACDSLDSIIVTSNNQSYASIDGVLFNKNLDTLICYPAGKGEISYVIPVGVTSIEHDAFQGCSLTNVTIPNSVTNIGDGAFFGCWSLTSVIIPDSVTIIGEDAFSDCVSLTSITVDTNNPNYTSADGVLLNKTCDTLIQYPAGKNEISYVIPIGVTTIGYSAFTRCRGLTNITIPDSVVNIGDYAFDSCRDLVSVTISSSVTTIGEYAFHDCVSLTDIYYTSFEADWAAISIGSGNIVLTNATIHFPVTTKGNVCASYKELCSVQILETGSKITLQLTKLDPTADTFMASAWLAGYDEKGQSTSLVRVSGTATADGVDFSAALPGGSYKLFLLDETDAALIPIMEAYAGGQ